jgi:hypothetical protein
MHARGAEGRTDGKSGQIVAASECVIIGDSDEG